MWSTCQKETKLLKDYYDMCRAWLERVCSGINIYINTYELDW